jgi:hypothetical protein
MLNESCESTLSFPINLNERDLRDFDLNRNVFGPQLIVQKIAGANNLVKKRNIRVTANTG